MGGRSSHSPFTGTGQLLHSRLSLLYRISIVGEGSSLRKFIIVTSVQLSSQTLINTKLTCSVKASAAVVFVVFVVVATMMMIIIRTRNEPAPMMIFILLFWIILMMLSVNDGEGGDRLTPEVSPVDILLVWSDQS